MKTTTILSAYEQADSWIHYPGTPTWPGRFMQRRVRQWQKFHAALVSRIEAGDRAREALTQVEWDADEERWYCPWCNEEFEILSKPEDRTHAPDCTRQAALIKAK